MWSMSRLRIVEMQCTMEVVVNNVVPTSNSHWSLRFNAFNIKNQIVQLNTIELQMIPVN